MNDIVTLVANALPNEKRYILLCGAGVSRDAGVPTGWEIMLNTADYIRKASPDYDEKENVEDWFKNSSFKDATYSELLEKVFPTTVAQQEYLSGHLDNKDIGEAHSLIAQLAKRGIIKAIITTNFDRYIEKALDKEELSYQVISSNEDLITSEPLGLCKKIRIYKPHGTIGVGQIRNTPADLQEFPLEYASELKKIISEHGLIVLGYAGNEDDKALLDIIENSNFYGRQIYPIFWVNPCDPEGRMKAILENKSYINLKFGAAEFIKYFFEIQSRLDDLAPDDYNIKTVTDIQIAFERQNVPLKPLYEDFLKNLKSKIEDTRPSFENYQYKDDAIMEQILKTKNILIDFTRAAKLAIDYNRVDLINMLYENFWNLSYFYSVPKDYRDSFNMEVDFNGFQFLIIEMMVSFISLLLKNDKMNIIGELLNYKSITKQTVLNPDDPVDYTYFYKPLRFGIQRRDRLGLNRASIPADIIKENFEDKKLNSCLSFNEYIEADYLLHLCAIFRHERWYPISVVYLESAPEFLTNSYRRSYYDNLLKNLNISEEQFIGALKNSENEFGRNMLFDLEFFRNFNIENLGKF